MINEEQEALKGRRFVLLQGPSSRFFSHLGQALRARGATVARVGFCPGDRLFWSGRSGRYHAYRGDLSGFSGWLHDLIGQDGTTDIVMLGDGRAAHVAAIRLCREHLSECRIWIVEHGYLRPGLVLIEPDGMGGGSTIPERFRPDMLVPKSNTSQYWAGSFLRYAAMDVTYHLSNLALAWLRYPQYRPHSGIHPLAEYGGWAIKALTGLMRRRGRERAEAQIAGHVGPKFIYPLQLSHDFQLTRYGTGEAQASVLSGVIQAFLEQAPPDAMLVVKVHPLDNGLTDWRGVIAATGAGDKVVWLDGGDLDTLLRQTAGVVTVNSTVGLMALRAGVPTHVLGRAVYDLPGMTDPGPLARFWTDPQGPDGQIVAQFTEFLRAGFHVQGSFDGHGAPVGAANLADWLAAPAFENLEDVA
ncbi:MAG: hypothetical protein KUG69_13115 [Marinosulfonomonas sp.]|nr:hypothetical protein [Marinosulfonomonas sp.]